MALSPLRLQVSTPGTRYLSTTRTLRIENELDEAIQEMARKERVSVNFLVNRALRRLVEWDGLPGVTNMMMITPEVLIKLMEGHTMKQAEELGRWVGRSIFTPYIHYVSAEVTLSSALETVRRVSVYANRFNYAHNIEGSRHVLVLRHSLGARWSAFYAGVIEEVFETSLGIAVTVKRTEETCVAEFSA